MIEDTELVNSLLRQGLIDQATLKEGIERTRKSGRPLYETLIFGRLIAEDKLVGLVGRLLKVPTITVVAGDFTPALRQLVPASMARRNRVIPVELRDEELVLGMVDPLDVLAMDEIATHTGIDIRPVLVGPAAVAEAIEAMYGLESELGTDGLSNDMFASFDDFDVQGMMDEVMAGDEWSDLFEQSNASTEDSAVLSRDMRDRPSTDVLAEEDIDAATADDGEAELVELEIIEELGKPTKMTAPYALLDNWDVDEALTSGKAGSAQILSAQSAEEFFRSGSTGGAKAREDEEEGEEDDTGIAASEPASELLDTNTGRTSVGLGIDHLRDDALGGESRAASEDDEPDDTGRTAMGVGPAALAEPEAEAEGITRGKAAKRPRRESLEDTDYGALGRAILKSGPGEAEGDANRKASEKANNVAPAAEPSRVRETQPDPVVKKEQHRGKAKGALGEAEAEEVAAIETAAHVPATDVIVPGALQDELSAPLSGAETMGLPAGVDTESLALALASLLVQKGILTADEIVLLARTLKS